MIVLKFLNQLTAKECPLLSDPQNGLVDAPSYTVRSTARYSCQTGYELVGMKERECLTSAKWSGSPPSCISKISFSSVIYLSIYPLSIYLSIPYSITAFNIYLSICLFVYLFPSPNLSFTHIRIISISLMKFLFST